MSRVDLVLLHAPSVYDFRKESILYGPVSDLVPSTPVFEMYPIGFTTIAEYLERHGFRVRIVNLAVRMLRERRFDPEAMIRSLNPAAFGIDFHWMPHAHGAIEVARLVKKYHPNTPVIFGGFSSTYFNRELMDYPEVDFVVRGDSTEEPMRQLMKALRDGGDLSQVGNLTWRDSGGQTRVNPIGFSPDTLDHVLLDYSYVIRSVARYRDLASTIPFRHWLDYPITAALTCRGCTYGCKTCGGSASAFEHLHERSQPAYRSPKDLAQDLKSISQFSKGPVFVLGDIRQPGMDYAEAFLDAVKGFQNQVILELFEPATREFIQLVGRRLPHWTLEVSLESHDDEVRQAFGRPYTTAGMERTMEYALEAGCERLDVFFMIGLPKQTFDSVIGTADYSQRLVNEYGRGGDHRLIPFISPLAPFLDPGSEVFERPAEHGYQLFCRTLEEHRQALVQPSWKYVLNYETEWMNRDQIVDSTYEAGLRLNRTKMGSGIITQPMGEATEKRIHRARRLIAQIDDIMSIGDAGRRGRLLRALKPQVDSANISTVCEKSELELPLGWAKLNIPAAAAVLLRGARQRAVDSSRKAEP
jgi:B12-binding domain/radical SAM domain protein